MLMTCIQVICKLVRPEHRWDDTNSVEACSFSQLRAWVHWASVCFSKPCSDSSIHSHFQVFNRKPELAFLLLFRRVAVEGKAKYVFMLLAFQNFRFLTEKKKNGVKNISFVRRTYSSGSEDSAVVLVFQILEMLSKVPKRNDTFVINLNFG